MPDIDWNLAFSIAAGIGIAEAGTLLLGGALALLGVLIEEF